MHIAGSAVQAVASVGEAVGTISAVVVALFLQLFRVRRRAPDLSLLFSPAQEAGDRVLVAEGNLALYVRLRVSNAPKKDMARNVEILLLHVGYPPGSVLPGVMPSRNLAWADVPDQRLSIPSNVYRRVDFLNLWTSAASPGTPQLTPSLAQHNDTWPPADRQLLTAPGLYDITLAITAENCDATYWSVKFQFSPQPVSSVGELAPIVSDLSISRS